MHGGKGGMGMDAETPAGLKKMGTRMDMMEMMTDREAMKSLAASPLSSAAERLARSTDARVHPATHFLLSASPATQRQPPP